MKLGDRFTMKEPESMSHLILTKLQHRRTNQDNDQQVPALHEDTLSIVILYENTQVTKVNNTPKEKD